MESMADGDSRKMAKGTPAHLDMTVEGGEVRVRAIEQVNKPRRWNGHTRLLTHHDGREGWFIQQLSK